MKTLKYNLLTHVALSKDAIAQASLKGADAALQGDRLIARTAHHDIKLRARMPSCTQFVCHALSHTTVVVGRLAKTCLIMADARFSTAGPAPTSA